MAERKTDARTARPAIEIPASSQPPVSGRASPQVSARVRGYGATPHVRGFGPAGKAQPKSPKPPTS